MVTLRPPTPSDRDTLREWRNRPEVSHFLIHNAPIGEEEHAEWFSGLGRDPSRRAWVIERSGRGVGFASFAGLSQAHGRCSLGMYLADPGARTQGVGAFAEYGLLQYAFETLGLNKVCCEVLAFNERVLTLHERLGFAREGRLREHVRREDGTFDLVLFALLRRDWPDVRARFGPTLGRKVSVLPPLYS